jgi:predicted transcriptional regulator of viral defense system
VRIAGLSPRETQLLSSWERERRHRVTLDDFRRLVGHTAPLVAKRMAKKGVLERVGRGVYWIRPLRALAARASSSASVLVASLLADEPYYLGGLWGLTFHRLSQQQYTSRIDAFVQRRRRSRALGHAQIRFHVLKPAALKIGVISTRIEGVTVNLSDAERTVLDLLDSPELAGGLRIALPLVEQSLDKIDTKKLIQQAIEVSRSSTCQRLGILLERAGISRRALTPLHRRTKGTTSRLSMIPSRPRHGRLNMRWNVVENDVNS